MGGKSRIAVSTADVNGTIKLRIPGWRVTAGSERCMRYTDKSSTAHGVRKRNGVGAVPDATDTCRSIDGGRTVTCGSRVSRRSQKGRRRRRVTQDARRMAVERGPIVYCFGMAGVREWRVLTCCSIRTSS